MPIFGVPSLTLVQYLVSVNKNIDKHSVFGWTNVKTETSFKQAKGAIFVKHWKSFENVVPQKNIEGKIDRYVCDRYGANWTIPCERIARKENRVCRPYIVMC